MLKSPGCALKTSTAMILFVLLTSLLTSKLNLRNVPKQLSREASSFPFSQMFA
ncbi:MAG: hypothetical protein U0Z17_05740 [Bacteroidales bacterium]